MRLNLEVTYKYKSNSISNSSSISTSVLFVLLFTDDLNEHSAPEYSKVILLSFLFLFLEEYNLELF